MSAAPQTTEYWMPDQGALLSKSAGGAPLRLSKDATAQVVRDNTYGLPVGFFVALIGRETNYCWNEVDTDYDSAGNARAAKTYGLCQLTKTEFARALSSGALSDADACDPATNCSAFARIINQNADTLDALAKSYGGWISDFERYCYIAASHNRGLSDIVKKINATSGPNWQLENSKHVAGSQWFDREVSYAQDIATAALNDYLLPSSDTGGGASDDQQPEVGTSSDTTLLRLGVLVAIAWLGYLHFVRG